MGDTNDCKKEIIEMIGKIDNTEWLRFVHRLVKNLIE